MDIQDFLKTTSSNIGIDEGSARSAAGGIFGLIKDQVGGSDYSSLVEAIPGAASVADSAPKASGGSGLMGKIGGALPGALGDKLGGAAGILSIFQKSGMDTNQAGKFISSFFQFAKDSAGGDVVERILNKMPDVKKLVG